MMACNKYKYAWHGLHSPLSQWCCPSADLLVPWHQTSPYWSSTASVYRFLRNFWCSGLCSWWQTGCLQESYSPRHVPVYMRKGGICEHQTFQKEGTPVRMLQLARITERWTHLCNRGVALETLSQGLASFNTQIIRADSDLLHIIKASKGHRPSSQSSHQSQNMSCQYHQSIKQNNKQTTSGGRHHAKGMYIADKVVAAES